MVYGDAIDVSICDFKKENRLMFPTWSLAAHAHEDITSLVAVRVIDPV